MTQELLHNLNIPISCKINRKLTKKQFIENFPLKPNEKKILSETVDNITLEYLLNKDNININPFVNEDVDYSEVAFIKVKIFNVDKLKQISTIIQNIPYPLIVLFVYEDSICVNISPKRINKNDSTKLVIEETYFTKWIELKNAKKIELDFIDSLKIHNHPFTDFLSFYKSYLDKIIAFNASEHSGSLKVNENTKAILDEIANCESEISELKNKIKKETSFNDKVNMNIQLKKINDKLKGLKEQL